MYIALYAPHEEDGIIIPQVHDLTLRVVAQCHCMVFDTNDNSSWHQATARFYLGVYCTLIGSVSFKFVPFPVLASRNMYGMSHHSCPMGHKGANRHLGVPSLTTESIEV